MAWDFETDQVQELLDWADAFVRRSRAARPHLAAPAVHRARRNPASGRRPLKEQVRRKACGPPTWPRTRWAGLRAAEAGAAQRDSGPVASGRPSSSAVRRPTPATPRSSRTTAPRSRKSSTPGRCSTARCFSCLLDDRGHRRRRPHAVRRPRSATATTG